MNKLNQPIQQDLKRSTRSKRAETMDGRKHNVMEREAFYLSGIIRSAPLLSPLHNNEEIKPFYDEKGQEAYRSIKAAVCLAVQVMKSAIKLNSHPHVCFPYIKDI